MCDMPRSPPPLQVLSLETSCVRTILFRMMASSTSGDPQEIPDTSPSVSDLDDGGTSLEIEDADEDDDDDHDTDEAEDDDSGDENDEEEDSNAVNDEDGKRIQGAMQVFIDILYNLRITLQSVHYLRLAMCLKSDSGRYPEHHRPSKRPCDSLKVSETVALGEEERRQNCADFPTS
ncbi:MAG: hypothetical protein M1818_007564 [Claussenomyces sp. TS43310]|nr:MAG: hypothetical protein M1818_007564 [Claussenomyces sp. TS43310]